MFGTTATDYMDGIEWEDTKLNIIQTEEGRAVNTTSNGYAYEYFLKDHLGNTRSGFAASSQTTAKFVSNFYPFGLSFGQGIVTTPKNRYLYNGKELQDGSNLYDYGARSYDPVIGRLCTIDPKADIYFNWSPYTYALNTPTNAIDPDGKLVIFVNGNHFGSGGKIDYWKDPNDPKLNFARAFVSHFNDHNSRYPDGKFYDGAMGGFVLTSEDFRLNPSVRFQEGYKQGYYDAASIINSLARSGGVITESIKIAAHSLGVAYAKGLVLALKEYARLHPEETYGLKITEYDFAGFQQNQAQLTADPDISTYQIDNSGDNIANGIIGLSKGSNHAKEKGLNEKNYNPNANPNGGHSILDFIGEISKLAEGTYRYENGNWVKE